MKKLPTVYWDSGVFIAWLNPQQQNRTTDGPGLFFSTVELYGTR